MSLVLKTVHHIRIIEELLSIAIEGGAIKFRHHSTNSLVLFTPSNNRNENTNCFNDKKSKWFGEGGGTLLGVGVAHLWGGLASGRVWLWSLLGSSPNAGGGGDIYDGSLSGSNWQQDTFRLKTHWTCHQGLSTPWWLNYPHAPCSSGETTGSTDNPSPEKKEQTTAVNSKNLHWKKFALSRTENCQHSGGWKYPQCRKTLKTGEQETEDKDLRLPRLNLELGPVHTGVTGKR